MSALKRALVVLAAGLASLLLFAGLFWAVALRSVAPAKPVLSARLARGSLEHGGRTRTFHYYIPAQVEPAPALVVVFHPSMGTGPHARAAFAYEFDRLADRHGFIVAYPDGVEGHWNDCRKKAPYAARRLRIDDVGFTRALVAHFAAQWNVDADRVFATGVSNGGQMAIRLALEAPDLVRAVAPVVASLPAPANMSCRVSGVPVSILFMNGTADPMNPYDGGDVALYGIWGNRGRVVSGIESAAWFAKLAGYTAQPERSMLPDRNRADGSDVERLQWDDPDGKAVALYSIRGGGHTVPHPTTRAPRLLGRTNADFTAAEEIWSFLSSETMKTKERAE